MFHDNMKFYGFFVFLGMGLGICGNIVIKAKFLGNFRVTGDSYSAYAVSVSQCLALCNKNKSCDAVTFNDELNKCRLFKKCVPMQILDFDINYSFYARRPPVADGGYYYEENSDSCLKVTNVRLPYKFADQLCVQDKGYLAVLHTTELKQLAKEILKFSGSNEAWISPPFKSYERYARNNLFRRKRRVDDLNSNDRTNDDCWLMKNYIVANQSTCDEEKRLSLCQLPTY